MLPGMKTTLDIPDAMYRAVKSRSAGAGLSVRRVTIMLYGAWLATPDWKPQSSSFVSDLTAAPPPARRLGCLGVAAKYARKNVSHEMDDIRASIMAGHERDLFHQQSKIAPPSVELRRTAG